MGKRYYLRATKDNPVLASFMHGNPITILIGGIALPLPGMKKAKLAKRRRSTSTKLLRLPSGSSLWLASLWPPHYCVSEVVATFLKSGSKPPFFLFLECTYAVTFYLVIFLGENTMEIEQQRSSFDIIESSQSYDNDISEDVFLKVVWPRGWKKWLPILLCRENQ